MSRDTDQRYSRRTWLKLAGGAAVAGMAGCTSGGTGSGGSDSYKFGFANMGLAGDPWLKSFQNGFKWYAQDHGHEISITDAQFDPSKQIQDVKNLLQEDIDALAVSPLDSKALAKAVNDAASQGVPVFTANSTAFSEKIKMFTAFGNANAAGVAADLMIQRLKDRYGEAKGTVVEVLMPQKAKTFVQRHKGFKQRMDKESNIEIVNQVQVNEASTADVTNKLSTVLQNQGDFDALYCPDLTSEIGAFSALENQNRKVKKGKDGHIIMTGIDAGPTILKEIKNGYMDASVDQPNLFYGPITLKYAIDFLDSGKDPSVLPDMGTKMTSDDLDISGDKHLGLSVWKKPLWAPANVQKLSFEGGSHRFFRTKEVVVTQDNADSKFLWGNLAQKY